jgi:creatinine amidohydrolase
MFTSFPALSRRCSGALAALILALPFAPARAASVYLEDLTSPELQKMIASGTTTVLVPIGGTEQNGPHMALGKHNTRARLLAGQIAERLGNAVVAPVISYVPEGTIHPPAAHMRYAGTLSIPDAAFEAMLAATARSLKQHGFHDVFFLGDHGDYQKNEVRVAALLQREWAGDPTCRAHALLEYYRSAQAPFAEELKRRGFSAGEIGSHAGLADTALTLALDKSLVRPDLLGRAPAPGDGTSGDPRRATAELGAIGVRHIVDASVAAIRAQAAPASPSKNPP